ncbi:MAG: tRNA/rRNA cytosine-C5-methylase [Actinobacteria bacterium]|nr:tRNA/rRNA cytosine-C5-methylase [Actinomycetota bacterium]NDE26366.1 tRNA/rRNA cytosine-C5-methylase [Actinomycetota bacterium]NDE36031.1 tRNA/rRNA cytosine-C5-methylase [Actinomycetota bacterium]NDF93072.1 tRNA/rRNA cytosine-C5-methylase [Actinomycetota bacterium]
MSKKPKRIADARLLAFEVLVAVELEGAYSNLILPKVLTESALDLKDRAFATELVYGTLRMRGRHDHFIASASDRSLEQIDPKALIVLRLGAHQLKEMRVPSHAAIFETVELAKKVVGKSTASFINAILRRVDSLGFEALKLPTQENSRLALEYSHPEWIVSSYFDSLKNAGEVINLLKSNNRAATPTLIAWPGLASIDELLEAGALAIATSPVAASFDGNPGTISAVRERRAGVQDLGSQLVVEKFYELFAPELRWLDLCAGPGGKAAYLSALLKRDGGSFLANEISNERARLVSQVLHHGEVCVNDGRSMPEIVGRFDRILLDAPCTGIGALRRRPEVRWRRTLQDLKNLTQLQSELLDSAARMLSPGGVIAYVTCSSHQAETKFQVRSFLKRYSIFVRIPVNDTRADNDGDLQLWPHRDGTDAMFLSLLRKEEGL